MVRLLHGWYWVVPLLTALLWLTTLIGLLGYWRADDLRQYEREEADVVFVSDVGAAHHPFFIGLCCATAGMYMLTVLLERHLRHQRRIPGSVKPKTTHYDITSVVFAIIGSLALIMLSIFDAFNYSTVHWSMTVVFIIGVALSVLFQVLQVFSLAKSHPNRRGALLATAIVKAVILSSAIIIAIAFAALYGTCRGKAPDGDVRCNRITSAAAVCEWVVSFLLAFYFFSYIVDLWPARKRAQQGLTEDGEMVEDRARAVEHGVGYKPDAPAAHHAHSPAGMVSQTTLTNSHGSPQMKQLEPMAV